MREGQYRRRLAEDLVRWQGRGWVAPEGAAAILASLDDTRPAVSLSRIIAMLGAVLLGAGVLAIVAANWEAIPRLVRFVLLLGAMGVAYTAAGLLARRGQRHYAEAALLVAGLVFAASIALVGQSYHLSGEFADAVLLWAAGCLGAAWLSRSPTLTTLALAGAAYLTAEVTLGGQGALHWPGLALILGGIATATWLDSRLARHAGILALGFWLFAALATATARHGWSPAGGCALAAAIAAAAWAGGRALVTLRSASRLAALGQDLLSPSLGAFLAALALLQIAPHAGRGGGSLAWTAYAVVALAAAGAAGVAALRRQGLERGHATALAGLLIAAFVFALLLPSNGFIPRLLTGSLVIAAAVWAVSLGTSGRQPLARSTGLFVFAAETVYLYVATLGRVLDTGLAFLVGGVLFIAIAALLLRLDRRMTARAGGASA